MKTMIQSVVVLVLLVLLGRFTAAAAQLPPEVQADAYLIQVEQAFDDGNYDLAWARLQDILRLQADNDLDLPELSFWYAKAAAARNMPGQALESVTEYLTASGRDARHYVEALELLNTLRMAVYCEGWNTDGYFETATAADVTACLEAGADVAARDEDGHTPLHRAAYLNENSAVVEALLAAGANLSAGATDNRHTPVHEAATNENLAVLEALLAAGGDIDALTEDNQTLLHYAARNENPKMVAFLVAAGADVAARDEDGRTPLHWAAWNNDNPAVVEALVAAGANVNEENASGNTPLDFARSNENPAVREALLQARAEQTEKQRAMGATGAAGASTGDLGAGASGGQCQIPGYPSPTGGVANLGLAWCPASVDFQMRAFALQAAGAQCAIATGSSSTPEQIQARQREIAASCERLAAMGVSNCQCPASYRP